ncbi:transposase [Streptosporangium sp. NPDC006013]|uniref:transposase n=1 Tax=Streptosporangium sp. NPDC006013 TaxID=3155596 RepID=UPI0033B875F8
MPRSPTVRAYSQGDPAHTPPVGGTPAGLPGGRSVRGRAVLRGAGKRANCQVALSVHLVTDAASCPVNRRLFVPEGWDPSSPRVPDAEAVTARRRRARISEEVAHVPKWRPAVDMLDEPACWGLDAPPVVADEGYGQDGAFRLALTGRNIAYVVGVCSDTALLAAGVCRTKTPYRGTGRRAAPRASKQRESRGIS